MPMVTILVNDRPRYVVRPLDVKALRRFLLRAQPLIGDGRVVSHRPAEAAEIDLWQAGRDLHVAWGGDEDGYFGVPLA